MTLRCWTCRAPATAWAAWAAGETEAMERRIVDILEAYKNRPHIFNLGHGVKPETPIANVERAVKTVRDWKASQ